MSVDLDMCSGCGACLVACAQENNVPPGDPAQPDRLIRWLELIPVETGSYPHVDHSVMPMPCQHCDNPPCVKVCPVDATYKNPEGLIPQIYPQCIGCRYCVNACPYSVKHFNWDTPEWPAPLEKGLNPDVSLRTRGVVEKCNFCIHRLQKAHDAAAIDQKPFQADSYRSACQEVCPTKAIHIGDLDDPDSKLAEDARGPRARRLLEDLGTEPKVIYLERRS
jgi:molybdopterin-containing oxidoreductase family iron-sulfur binding subunit